MGGRIMERNWRKIIKKYDWLIYLATLAVLVFAFWLGGKVEARLNQQGWPQFMITDINNEQTYGAYSCAKDWLEIETGEYYHIQSLSFMERPLAHYTYHTISTQNASEGFYIQPFGGNLDYGPVTQVRAVRFPESLHGNAVTWEEGTKVPIERRFNKYYITDIVEGEFYFIQWYYGENMMEVVWNFTQDQSFLH